MSRGYKGPKFDPALDVKEIAKRLRADYKLSMDVGVLPKMKISVTIDRYSGGQAIRVCIKEIIDFKTADVELWEEYTEALRQYNRHGEGRPPMLIAVIKRVEQMREAYNYDNSDTMTDYFDVNYYGGTDVAREVDGGFKL